MANYDEQMQDEYVVEQVKNEGPIVRFWNCLPKPVKIVVVGASAVLGAMFIGRKISVDNGYEPEEDGESFEEVTEETEE